MLLSFSSILMSGMHSFLLSATTFLPSGFSLPVGLSLLNVHELLKFIISASVALSFAAFLKSFMNLFKLGGEMLH